MAVGSRPFVPSRLAPGGVAHGSRRTPTTVLGAYIALTKPRIIELLLITTVPTMVLAQQGWPPTSLVIITLIGGTLAAGGANAVNMYVDRDIDALMARTRNRPLVTGVIPARNALIFALSLQVAAFAVLWAGANLLSAVLALRRRRLLRLHLHALAEAHEPPEHRDRRRGRRRAGARRMGRRAGFARLAAGRCCSLAMFLWTPPHFWALAIKYADDYRAADVPMLPAVAPLEQVVKQMLAYTVALVVTTLLLVPVADLGWIYGISAAVLGAIFIGGTIALGKHPTPAASMRLFGYSITYVTLLFGAMTLDVFVHYGF